MQGNKTKRKTSSSIMATSKRQSVKPSESGRKPSQGKDGLTLRQRKFSKYYQETGNGTKSAILAGYSEKGASQQASMLLRNPKVLAVLSDNVELAERTLVQLMDDDSAAIRLGAAKEVLDRTVGKAIQRSESVSINITVEQMLNSGTDKG